MHTAGGTCRPGTTCEIVSFLCLTMAFKGVLSIAFGGENFAWNTDGKRIQG